MFACDLHSQQGLVEETRLCEISHGNVSPSPMGFTIGISTVHPHENIPIESLDNSNPNPHLSQPRRLGFCFCLLPHITAIAIYLYLFHLVEYRHTSSIEQHHGQPRSSGDGWTGTLFTTKYDNPTFTSLRAWDNCQQSVVVVEIVLAKGRAKSNSECLVNPQASARIVSSFMRNSLSERTQGPLLSTHMTL